MTPRRELPAALALGVLGACIKVPAFEYQDAAIGSGDAGSDADVDESAVSITQNGSGGDVIVKGPGYQIRFSTTGSRFPDLLDAGGNSLLGSGQRCADEDGMGIGLNPVMRLNGAANPETGTPALTIPLEGPWVGQVRVSWNGTFSCSAGDGSIAGQSTFSFFPDGRLTRLDRITSGAARNISGCFACAGGTGNPTFVLTSYTALAVDADAYLSDGNLANLTTVGAEVTNPGSTACVRERQQSIAFAWTDTSNRLRVSGTAPERTIAFDKELFRGTALPADTWVTTTQMGISATEECGTLEDRLRPLGDSQYGLSINGSSVTAPTDGIFGGDPNPDGSQVTFPVTIQPGPADVPAGFAVWLHATPIPASFTVTHSAGHTGNWYRAQPVGANQLVLWFDVPLVVGEQITITAQ